MKSILYFQYLISSQHPYHHYYQTIFEFLKSNFKVSEITMKDDGLIEAHCTNFCSLDHVHFLKPYQGNYFLGDDLNIRYTGHRIIFD